MLFILHTEHNASHICFTILHYYFCRFIVHSIYTVYNFITLIFFLCNVYFLLICVLSWCVFCTAVTDFLKNLYALIVLCVGNRPCLPWCP